MYHLLPVYKMTITDKDWVKYNMDRVKNRELLTTNLYNNWESSESSLRKDYQPLLRC